MLLTLNYVGVDESWTVLDVSWKVEVAATQNSSAGVTALDPKGRLASFLTCKKTDALSHLTRTSFPYVDFNLSHYETSHKIVRLKKVQQRATFTLLSDSLPDESFLMWMCADLSSTSHSREQDPDCQIKRTANVSVQRKSRYRQRLQAVLQSH